MHSYIMIFLAILGIIYTWRKERKKYYYIYLTIVCGFLIPLLPTGFTDRYFIILLILFYLLAIIALDELHKKYLIKKVIIKSLIAVYIVIFILFNALIGIGWGTLPNIPHSFYKHFDADKFYGELKIFYDYVRKNVPQDEVIMSSNRPYQVYYFTGRPTIIFPFTDERGVQSFMKKYQVQWVIQSGHPVVKGDKFLIFWPEGRLPDNIKQVFKNTGGTLFKVEDYID